MVILMRPISLIFSDRFPLALSRKVLLLMSEGQLPMIGKDSMVGAVMIREMLNECYPEVVDGHVLEPLSWGEIGQETEGELKL